ncbi:hypothetical protein ACFB49_48460 [Sphingomonas sp. DBB INV C78]|uniref:hypothetical protein n=1 Tax=Sphingomonas sp. DBB INV C78 TaxID=3349434 RepID=UPI0036D31E7E
MSVISDFYQARADECAQQAKAATLDNVRDRSLRAEAAWQALADRHLRAEVSRAKRAADTEAA